jgi:hypothetical protein
MTDRKRLIKTFSPWFMDGQICPRITIEQLANAILAIIAERDKRIVELSAIAKRAGDAKSIEVILFKNYRDKKDFAEDISRWLLNGEGKDGG